MCLPVVQVELHGAYAETFQRYMSARLISGSRPTSKSLLETDRNRDRQVHFSNLTFSKSFNKKTLKVTIYNILTEEN